MIYATFLLNVLTIVAMLHYLKGRDEREATERAVLLQRIQAPEQAVIQQQVATAGEGEAIYPMTDEESAEAERALAIERIERMEREGVY